MIQFRDISRNVIVLIEEFYEGNKIQQPTYFWFGIHRCPIRSLSLSLSFFPHLNAKCDKATTFLHFYVSFFVFQKKRCNLIILHVAKFLWNSTPFLMAPNNHVTVIITSRTVLKCNIDLDQLVSDTSICIVSDRSVTLGCRPPCLGNRMWRHTFFFFVETLQ